MPNVSKKHTIPHHFPQTLSNSTTHKKNIFDAVDGYHAMALDKKSQPLTTFITEWGYFMHLRLPQRFVASGDAYTRRFDKIIRDVLWKVKIVDDALLHDTNIEQSFFHTWDYLTIGAKNGIVISKAKFQFCQETIEFAGLLITPDGISPSQK